MSDQDKDPVVHSSLSKPLFIWSALLVLSLAWGLYDEMYGIRPWKGYEARFEKLYGRYLKQAKLPEGELERQIKSPPNIKRLTREMNAAAAEAAPAAKKIDDQVADLVPKILALNDPFQEVRSHIGSLTYEIEVSKSESRKDSLRKQIEELKQETRQNQTAWVDGRQGDEVRRHGHDAVGDEGAESRTPATARGNHEEDYRAEQGARRNISPTASPAPAPIL